MTRPDAQQQLIWFRNAAPYINAHRGRCFVIHFSGETMQLDSFPGLIHDFALLHSLGIRLVLVHGARPQIEQNIQRQGKQSQYHKGLRITDTAGLQAVREAVGCLRVEMESRLSLSLPNTPMSGSRIRCISGNFVQARPLGVIDGTDYQHTGRVRRIDDRAIEHELELGHVVLLSPMGYSPTGEVFNLSAEDVAREAASSLNADKLIFISDCAELQETSKQLTPAQAQELINDNDLPGEILRHLRSAIHACEQGVHRVHLVDRAIDGALLQELYTRDGSGILITAEPYERLREATIEDVGGIIELISPLEEDGTLVRRSREQLELEIDHFRVLERDGMIIGCVALYPFADEGWGELACLVIHPDYRDQGQASRLLDHIETHARSLKLKELFVLTTQTAHWFLERGFSATDIDGLPVQKREMYNLQRQSKAFVKTL
jgi:amino-acid N-acetyltransferase